MKALTILLAGLLAFASPSYAADKGGLYIPDNLVPAFDEGPGPMSVWSGFYIEGGLGLAISNVDVGFVGEGDVLTLGESSWAGHIGVGYDKVIVPKLLVGLWGRVELDDLSYAIAGQTLADTELVYSLGGRVGYIPREDYMIYGLLGYAFSDLDFAAEVARDTSRDAWVVGGGLEVMLTDNVGLGAEYNAKLFNDETIEGVNLEAVDHSVRARLLYKF